MITASRDSQHLEDSIGADCAHELTGSPPSREQHADAACLGFERSSIPQPPAREPTWRANNRESQKRYRERQRDLKQQQAAESERQQDVIMRLSHSNKVLVDRNAHLEGLLLKALQDQLAQATQPSAPKQQMQQQQLAKRNDKGWLEPIMFEQGKAAVLNIKGPHVLYRDNLGVTSLEQIQPLLKALMSCMHASLVLCRTAPGVPAFQQIEEAVSQHLFVWHNIAQCNMMLAQEAMSADLDSCCPIKACLQGRWITLLDALYLSVDQKRQLVAACNEYQASLRPISHPQPASIGKAEEPLRIPTSRPAIARLQDVDASNAELLRAMRLEHETYGRLSVVFTTRVLNPIQTAVLCVRTWPIVPDIVAIGSVAERQLQAHCFHVHGSNQLASQQPWELVQRMDWLAPRDERLPQPSSRTDASLPSQDLYPASSHGQTLHEPVSASSRASKAPSVIIPSTAAAAADGASPELQHLWPINMDGRGRIFHKPAALAAACDLQLPSAGVPSRGFGQQTLSWAGSALPPWYMCTNIWDELQSSDANGPADFAQSIAADTPVQRLDPDMLPGERTSDPIHADPQQLGMQVGQASAGTTMASRDAARTALDSMGLLDLDSNVLLCLMPQ